MFCSKCGKQLEDNTRFCPQCGHSIVNEVAVSVKEEDKPIITKSNKKGNVTSWISFPITLIARLIFQQEFREYDLFNSRNIYRLDTIWMVILSLVTLLFVSLTLYSASKGKFQNKQAVYVILAIFTALSLLAIFLPISAAMFDF